MTDILIGSRIAGGNSKNGRHESDFYPTPPEATQALLNFLEIPKGTLIWEPACGEMDIVHQLMKNGYSVVSSDIRTGADFLSDYQVETDFDWIITNPPFSLADAFIWKANSYGKPFAFLLKIQFWNAAKRMQLFKKIQPTYILPLTFRPDFLFKEHDRKNLRLWMLCG